MLHTLAFELKKINGQKISLEREDAATLTCKINKEYITHAMWVDETWVNAYSSKIKGLIDNTVQGIILDEKEG